MATFTHNINAADAAVSGAFSAVVEPEATITLTADSAACAVISPLNFIGAPALLSLDANEGTDGDHAAITNAANTWTVPASAVTSDGTPAVVLVTYNAYNWAGFGCIVLDGFASIENSDYRTPIPAPEGIPGRITFPIEGGTRRFELGILSITNTEVRFGSGDEALSEYLGTRVEGAELVVELAPIPVRRMAIRNGKRFEALLEFTTPTGYFSMSVFAGYVLDFKTTHAPYVIELENEKSAIGIGGSIGESDATRVNSSTAAGTLNFPPSDYGEAEITLSIEAQNTAFNPTAPLPVVTLRGGTSAEASATASLEGEDRSFSRRIEFLPNESEDSRFYEVIITPANSPRSAVGEYFYQDPYTTAGNPELSVSPSKLSFGHEGGTQYVEVTSNAEAGSIVGVSASDEWITATPEGAISAAENTGEARSGTVVFSTESGLEASVYVTQGVNEIETASLSVSPGALSFGAEGGIRNVEVTSYAAGTVNVSTSAAWITATPEGMIFAAENTGEVRSGTVVFWSASGASASVSVEQSAEATPSDSAGPAPALFFRGKRVI